MSDLRGEVEGLATLVAPEIGVPVKMATWAMEALFAIVVAGIIVWAGWKLFFADGQANRAHDQAAAKAQVLVGNAQTQAGAAATNTVANGAVRETQIHEITRDHYVEITKQPGAGDPVSDPVWDAFCALCLHA
jgi:hypothetical protein